MDFYPQGVGILKVPVLFFRLNTLKDVRAKIFCCFFFIKLLLQLGFELLLSEMQKKLGFTDFVSEIRYLKGHSNFEKAVFLTRYDFNVCMYKNIANESLEQNLLCKFLHEWVYQAN